MSRGFDDSLDFLARARSQANPGAKVLAAARDVFNEQGYALAGINEIIARSKTSKRSFYHYYPSKKDLGRAYLLAEEAQLAALMDDLMRRYPENYRGFGRAWVALIRKNAVSQDYHGCPFARAAAQAPLEFRDLLEQIMERWRERIAAYLGRSDLALPVAKARAASKTILTQYQGSLQMWRLTGDASYFDLFEETLIAFSSKAKAKRTGKNRIDRM